MPCLRPVPRFLCMGQVGISSEGRTHPPARNRAPATFVTYSVTIFPRHCPTVPSQDSSCNLQSEGI